MPGWNAYANAYGDSNARDTNTHAYDHAKSDAATAANTTPAANCAVIHWVLQR